jgi:hypothetical protein
LFTIFAAAVVQHHVEVKESLFVGKKRYLLSLLSPLSSPLLPLSSLAPISSLLSSILPSYPLQVMGGSSRSRYPVLRLERGPRAK